MSFTDLVRDMKYKLQCHLETTEYLEENRSSVTRVITSFNNTEIKPAETPVLKCIDFFVKDLNTNFEQRASSIIQEAFYDNFEENGCVLTIDSDKSFI